MGRLGRRFVLTWQGLRARPAESLLLLLLFAVVFCASLTAGALVRSGRRELRRNIEHLGRDIIQVHPSPTLVHFLGGGKASLKRGDVPRIAEAAGGPAAGARLSAAVVQSGSQSLSTCVVECSPLLFRINRSVRAEGRFFLHGEKGLCVLDVYVAGKLLGPGPFCGKKVTVRFGTKERELRVVGVLDDPLTLRKRLQGCDVLSEARPLIAKVLEARNVYVPFGTFHRDKKISLCLAQHGASIGPGEAAERVRAALGSRAKHFTVWARGPWIDKIMEMLQVAYLFSNAVWAFFVGIAEAMIVTVGLAMISDRQVEFGILRAEGATRADIALQILLEGIAVGGGGALLGAALSPLVSAYLSRHVPWAITLRSDDAALTVAVGMALVLISFLLPAYRAARLDPVTVLQRP